MKQRRIERYHVTDIKLADSHKIIEVDVNYSSGSRNWLTGEMGKQGIHISTLFCEKTGCSTSFQMFGDTHLKTLLVPMDRFNAKKLEEIAGDIINNREKSILYGEAYTAIIEETAKRNSVTIASSDEDAYKVAEFEVGQRVRKLQPKSETTPVLWTGVIVAREMDEYGRGMRYQVVDDDAWHWHYVEAVDHHSKLELTGEPDYSLAQIAERVKAALDAEAERKAEDARKAQEKTDATAVALQDLKVRYPWAKQDGSSHARAAANLRRELHEAFPGIAFSVTSESYSGGNSVKVSWVNGPTDAQVREVSEKYQYTYLTEADILSDGTSYKSTPEHKAVDQWLGTAKYVSASRMVSEDVRAEVRAELVRYYGDEETMRHGQCSVHSATSGSEIYGKFKEFEIAEGRLVAVFEKPEFVEPVVASATDIEVKENPERGGIEIKFKSRPDDTILEQVKRLGFRWSRRQHLWYAKVTEARRDFAFSLV
jgi:hypothetical protein